MNNRKITTGIIIIILTGVLAAFYWVEFFPSEYTIKLILMLMVWLFQTAGILLFIRFITSDIKRFGSFSFWVLGVFLIFVSLFYCIGSSTPKNDRDLVKDFLIKDKKIELYHLDRHDHTAIEIFYGNDGMLAKRYFKDHFTVKNIELKGEKLFIKNSIQANEIILDVGKAVLLCPSFRPVSSSFSE